jgi:hypothetical protein
MRFSESMFICCSQLCIDSVLIQALRILFEKSNKCAPNHYLQNSNKASSLEKVLVKRFYQALEASNQFKDIVNICKNYFNINEFCHPI